jgi:heme/copper-type cytochrome/quinol oxidase subunit 2
VFPFYCTDFCSALHQEMQGYIRVSPKGAKTELKWNSPSYREHEDDHDVAAVPAQPHGTH